MDCGFPGGRAGIGIGTIVILGLIGWALGIDPRVLIGGAEMMSRNGETQQQSDAGSTASPGAPSDEMGQFVSAVLGSTEVQWKDIFAQAGKTYTTADASHVFWSYPVRLAGLRKPRWVLFTVRSTRRSTSTPASFRTSSGAFVLAMSEARPASSPKRM